MSNVGIVIQSFAIFVALSTMLGRIYFLRYMDVLGVPHTDVRLNVTEYALLSPDVTIFGIGIALIFPAMFLFRRQLEAVEMLLPKSKFWMGLSALMWAVASTSIGMPFAAPYVSILPGVHGLVLVLLLVLGMYVVPTFLSRAFPGTDGDNEERQSEEIAERIQQLQFFQGKRYGLTALLGFIIVFIIVWNTSVVAGSNALAQLQTAPIAKVEFDPPIEYESNDVSTVGCNVREMCKDFRVVLMGEEFIYLFPNSCSTCTEVETELYAVRVDDVVALSFTGGGATN